MASDPHPHRLTIGPADAHVVVRSGDVTLAVTDEAVQLLEGSLPARYYIPRRDIAMDKLTAVDQTSHCPFKGDATYWAFGDDAIAWTYETPLKGAEPIAGLIAFYNERTEITVDGERV